MPIGNQSDAIVKTCRSKRAYSFLICTRTLSNSKLAARAAIRVACGYVGEGALPSDIGFAAVPARMFDEYFTGWKPDREAHGGSLASYIEDLGGQTRLGVVMCAFDHPDGASWGDRALSAHGNRRCD